MHFFSRSLSFLLLATTQALAAADGPAKTRPNIIFIEVDDLLYTYASPWGSKTAVTPALDRLAQQGLVFDQAMCQGMMCGPSRNSLMTGLYPHQMGFCQNGQLRKLPQDVWTLPHALQRAGYTTAWIGKSHLKPYFTNQKEKFSDAHFNQFFGFDYSLHTLGRALVGDSDGAEARGGGPNPYMTHLEKRGLMEQYQADAAAKRNSTLPEDDYLDGWFTRNAETYLASYNTNRPLFLWLNYSVPHGPYDVAEPYHKPFEKKPMPGLTKPANYKHPESLVSRTGFYRGSVQATNDQRGFYANIHFMDTQVNRILEALRKKAMLDNSWIVFFSDQGVMSGAQGLIHKSTLFRQITQPCLIIRPPGGMTTGKRTAQPVELLDLLPTFVEVGGLKDEKVPAGESMLPLFTGGSMKRKFTFGEIDDWIVVSDGHYRLIRSVKDEPPLLFDDLKDPENLTNVAEQNPEIAKRLGQAIDQWLAQTGPRKPARAIPTPNDVE
jgi:arylsulfatase A-like enzyme